MAHPNKDKNIRLERHSAGKTRAYGALTVRSGSGKYNWGNTTSELLALEYDFIDEGDPMYDSENEQPSK
ncbi:conserved Plasmodium protein, unknown function [Plasmodium chabaudi chabaudi]|uniref:Hyaluronan/mRNA-binding protein domain-containing protein n=2 Tax=Plasmodium chabaudi TaxID=5825 RepID=A0A077TVE9_PLACU|nr:conserved protein, unknown function [Plasmodium chabaudi chabaudi]SCM25548.1 conserved Plasmodium protein, unknown function [Plasmodium chabaudi adami]SCM26732.1 conserved Plasmodium protein, unknown function [Plasmodium chabaudi chabaudi]SCN63478.1 conserved Plasmodium protein, unknown function [Plasmodium chabaudi chabaudi]VTZ71195.1 conserved protein, unknown function [Plasmodium chabaudi chabaudi]|eukprot:XP_016655034.1 conserved Plasmodium protein, unknown function [Plasmodium chabaudi chabaudi]